MAENRRDRDKRIYFSRGQLVLLGGAFTLTALVIFLLGIVVGRGIEERKVARPEEPLIKIPVKPSGQGGAAAPNGQAKEELTFYDTLSKSSGIESSLEDRISDPNPVQIQGKGRITTRVVKSRGKAAGSEAEYGSGVIHR